MTLVETIEFEAVRGVNLSIGKGEIFGLLESTGIWFGSSLLMQDKK